MHLMAPACSPLNLRAEGVAREPRRYMTIPTYPGRSCPVIGDVDESLCVLSHLTGVYFVRALSCM